MSDTTARMRSVAMQDRKLIGYWRAVRNWSLFAVLTVFYGCMSLSLGWIPGERKSSQLAMLGWSRNSCRMLGIHCAIDGTEHLDDLGQVILVANHLSLLDILVVGCFLEFDYRWLAKSSLFKVPFLGWHLALCGHIPVYRGEQRKKNRGIGVLIQKCVREGACVFFFPEGTRSSDGHLKKFHRGAFEAAVRENLPVVPMVLKGTHELMVKGSRNLHVTAGNTCSLTILPRIHPPTEGTESERATALLQQTRALMLAELGDQA